MQVKKITIVNELPRIVDYEMTYQVNKLFERGLIDYNKEEQLFQIQNDNYINVKHKKDEIIFTFTTKRKKVVSDLLGLM